MKKKTFFEIWSIETNCSVGSSPTTTEADAITDDTNLAMLSFGSLHVEWANLFQTAAFGSHVIKLSRAVSLISGSP